MSRLDERINFYRQVQAYLTSPGVRAKIAEMQARPSFAASYANRRRWWQLWRR